MEQGQGGPHDVGGGALPADADLAGERLVVVVTEHAALRRAGRAPGVDERAEVGGPDRHGRRRGVDLQHFVPLVHCDLRRRRDLLPGARLLAVVDHDHVLELREITDDRRDAIGERALYHDDTRAGIAQLMTQVLTLVRGVDGHRDRPATNRAEPGKQSFRRVLHEVRDAIARSHAECVQGIGELARGRVHLGGGERHAADVEVLAVRVVGEPAIEERGDRVLLAADPR